MQPTPTDPGTIRALLAEAERTLAAGPHADRARRDAETLLLHAMRRRAPDRNLAWLIAHGDDTVAAEATSDFCALTERRSAGEPVQYITGEAEFYGLTFEVNRDVLIPRPETELLVEKAIELAQKLRQSGMIPDPRIVDVGTGSGAIAVALAHELPFGQITATEISPAALAVAKANAARNGVADRVRFLEGDLLNPVGRGQFDLVISNPPYVPERDCDSLPVEVRNYEPAQALFAGEDGLAIYRRLLPQAFSVLIAGGILLVEIGYGQRAPVESLLSNAGFRGIEFTEDLQKIPRVAAARKP
jgi:release factor glutamine methyltransferase